MRITRKEIKALREENELLSLWYRGLQETYVHQHKLLEVAIKFIERQSGAYHYKNMQFVRDNGSDFSINEDGSVNVGEVQLPPNPFGIDQFGC